MGQVASFIFDNALLFAALIAITIMIITSFAKERLLGFTEIKAAPAVQLINHKDAVVVDIRSDDAYAKGHIIDAIHLPAERLEDSLDQLAAYRDRAIIVCCNSGRQSAKAASLLAKNGFSAVYKLAGGMMSWESAHLPLERT